ncbi:hypothetical protein Tco_0614607 [Tanacetum coccineum]
MVTEKTASTPTPTTTQAHAQMCSTSCWKDISKRSLEVLVGARKTETDKRLLQRTDGMVSTCSHDPRQSLEDLPRDHPLVSVEVLRISIMDSRDTLHNPPLATQILKGFLVSFLMEFNTLLSSISLREILLKMNLSDHRIKLWWKWRYLVPVESIHSPMLTLNVFNQRQHDNLKTYNTASATLISNVMIKKSVSMPVRRSQHHMKAMLLNKDD